MVAALTGMNALPRQPLPPALGVQLMRSTKEDDEQPERWAMYRVGTGRNEPDVIAQEASDRIDHFRREAIWLTRKSYTELVAEAIEAAMQRGDRELADALSQEIEPSLLMGGDELTLSLHEGMRRVRRPRRTAPAHHERAGGRYRGASRRDRATACVSRPSGRDWPGRPRQFTACPSGEGIRSPRPLVTHLGSSQSATCAVARSCCKYQAAISEPIMKAQLATPAAGSPALRSAAAATASGLASMIGNRATREALTGAHVLPRSPPPSSLPVQLARSAARAPSGHQSHPARTYRDEHGDAAIHAAAARGIATPWSALPHASRIQHSFGHHDISPIQAHVGETAAASATEMHADAYATGNHVVLGSGTDLFTVAHEAAHVVQQRAGVQLKGGVGAAGDQHEQHADAVAARVTAGQSAEALLDTYTSRNAAGPGFPRTTSLADLDAAVEVGPSPGAVEATSATSVAPGSIQRKTSIVDDTTDPQNATKKGSGRGLLKDSAGNIRAAGDYTFGPLRDGCGTFMEAWIDPLNCDQSGTEPKPGTWPSWWAAAAPNPNHYWVRGHLLNHKLGGPGEQRNLTPITKKANHEHHDNVEQILKDAAQVGASLIGYHVEAKYDSIGPTQLKGDAWDPHPSVWNKLTVGFDCEYAVLTDDGDWERTRFYVENER